MGERLALGLLGLMAIAGPVNAATFTVNNTGDGVDVAPGNGVCATASATCTLRAAIMEANATVAADVIRFNIAGAGPHTITPGSALPNISRPVTIDGTTEPDFVTTPVVELNGTSAGGVSGLILVAGSSGSVIRGLAINRFGISGVAISGSNNNLVEGNFLGTDPSGTVDLGNVIHGIQLNGGATGNVIGGSSGAGNLISGNNINGVDIVQAGTSNNRVIGNVIGLDRFGNADLGNTFVGVAIGQGATANIIGEAGGGNVISGNNQHGIRLVDGATSNNRVQNNYIGLDATGMLARGNGADGVRLESNPVAATGNVIGGTTAGLGNVISGNTGSGIGIFNVMTGTLIAGNVIGRSVDLSAAVPNTGAGIFIDSATTNNTTIGGPGANDPNVIASNGGDGIAIVTTAAGNNIQRNSIYSNGGLGIDLGNDGVTANDLGDGDIGPNGRQNFPVLSAGMTLGGNVNVAGSLNAAASTTHRVDFFATTVAFGSDEGERFLGSLNVATDAGGNAVFGVTFAAAASPGELLTATATAPIGNTSEFSAAITAVGNLIVTTTADTVDGNTASVAALIAAPGADGRISLREAIDATNLTLGADTIGFGIPLTDAGHFFYQNDSLPGSLSLVTATTRAEADISNFDPDYPAGLTRSWYRIRPASALSTISDAVVLDGSTQPGFVTGGPVIELDGSLAGATVDGLRLTAGSATVRVLVVNNFSRDGLRLSGPGAYSVTGNYLGTDVSGTQARANVLSGISFRQLSSASSTVGGNTPATRNIISGNTDTGVTLDGFPLPGISSQVRIQGNYIGTDVTGSVGLNAQTNGIYAEFTGGHLIGGSGAGEGNLISGNAGEGINLNGNNGGGGGTPANDWVVEGNRIGTNAAGTAVIANANRAIILYGNANPLSGASNNVIRGNVIAGSQSGTFGGNGIQLRGNTDNNVIENNFIGTDTSGTLDLGNLGSGVFIQGEPSYIATGNTVRGNVIRFNDLDGVRIEGDSSATITQNQVWTNGGLGINLGTDGVTSNDDADADAGPNDLLNWPFIHRVVESGGTLTVDLALDLPAGSYRVELFKNPSGADPSGNGEGQLFADFLNLTHAGAGFETFSHVFPGAAGEVVTATATFCTDGALCTAFGSTSELGNAFIEGVTAVELLSFEATGVDSAVELTWKTGSELKNLGFHLYRATSPSGPFERITEEVIAGLGSSPSGASYRHRDGGLRNGVTYFYQLEDIETTGRTTRHGPVSATPEEREDGRKDGRKTYGDPAEVSLRVLERSPRGALLELVTGGFTATASSDGTYRIEVPGFEELQALSLPVKRTWLEAVSGRGVRIAAIEAFEVTNVAGLEPSSGSSPEIVASPEGTVRAGKRRNRRAAGGSGLYPESAARVLETGFQQEVKKALLELSPLRWEGSSRRLQWTRRLRVRVSFAGVESRDRHRESRRHRSRTVVVQLKTSDEGLYRVPRISLPATEELRLSRRGEPVAYHLEGKALYFVGEAEAVYELESGPGGLRMPRLSSSFGPPVSAYLHREEREEDRYYQAGLLEASSLWFWDVVVSAGSKSFPFTASSLAEGEANLEVHLQGASLDHRVRLLVNGIEVAEESFAGKTAKRLEVSLPAGVLREGENQLTLRSEAEPSMVFLDRFAVVYPRKPVAETGVLKGFFPESGTLSLGERGLVVQTAPETAWLEGSEGGSFGVEAGRGYLAVAPEALLEAKLRVPPASRLRSPRNRADYLLIAPREFLPAAEPLLKLRRSQKLVARAVAVEELYDEFGYGEARAEAVKEFLEYAYHHWQKPSVWYVVLFGDASYDERDVLRTGVRNLVPTPIQKTSYLWTASDPSYASVNGEDGLPDLALGRLPAASVEEARALVEKLLRYEESGMDLGGPAVLVADDPDSAGDFEKDSDELASQLRGREVEKIYLRGLGRDPTRSSIREALDRGASLLSYVGHGGIALWASENVFESRDLEALSSQPRQPVLMTMNCLNGYFHFPYFDSLAEAFVKAEGKGAIAAFSPSGLSLNAPAHLYQRALVEELTSNAHLRLGDAVLAAQRTYAESGAFPELLAIYHLFGDPALNLR